MNILTVLLLSIIQGIAELLPISSSAHVIVAEKLLGLDPAAPAMTFLLVMLHTGTMIAVLLYFGKRWGFLLSSRNPHRRSFLWMLVAATVLTGGVGLGLQWLIEKVYLGGTKGAAVEDLFGNLGLIAWALAAAGVLIVVSGWLRRRTDDSDGAREHSLLTGALVGLVQGLSLPFRGFSRSGATISVGLLAGTSRRFAEEFSFFLAVILTLPVVGREALRLKAVAPSAGGESLPWLLGLAGLVFSFAAGFVAIRWLSSWLEKGRWAWFGVYCLAASGTLFALKAAGILV
jgi:undecaprenyl-diphosphatase